MDERETAVSDITWTNERRKLKELIPWPRNPRQIKSDQAKRLAQSFDEFGQVETIAIGPANEVYNGHQRLNVLMSKHGGDYEVECRVSSRPLTEKEREKLTVFLHKGAAGEWDFDTLANEFELDELLEWGFDKKELDLDLWAGEPEPDPGAQIDKAEELREKWGVDLGQLWQLGEHRLICGDCTDAAVVGMVMQGEKAGAVVTDPPYGINREGIENDDPEGLRALFDGCLAVMPIENAVVIAFQSPRLFPDWLDALREAGHKFERMLWMYKPNDETFPWRGWILKSESILVSTFGTGVWREMKPYAHDCYSPVTIGKELSGDWGKAHASVKPVLVVEDLINRVGGDMVYEPFLGSGTTLIACERLGRKCRAVEISPAYCAVAIQRWVDMTGGEPVILEDIG
jgi:hypothetical protein